MKNERVNTHNREGSVLGFTPELSINGFFDFGTQNSTMKSVFQPNNLGKCVCNNLHVCQYLHEKIFLHNFQKKSKHPMKTFYESYT